MAQTIRLEIPNYLPPRELSPNARCHWRVRFEAQNTLRDLVAAALHKQGIWLYASFSAVEGLNYFRSSLRVSATTLDTSSGASVLHIPFPWDAIEVKLIFYVKDARRRDTDNYIASMKAGLDAFQGRVIRDDKDIKSISVEFVKDKAKAPMTAIEVRGRAGVSPCLT